MADTPVQPVQPPFVDPSVFVCASRVRVVGWGPSLTERVVREDPDELIVALHDAVNACDACDFVFMLEPKYLVNVHPAAWARVRHSVLMSTAMLNDDGSIAADVRYYVREASKASKALASLPVRCCVRTHTETQTAGTPPPVAYPHAPAYLESYPLAPGADHGGRACGTHMLVSLACMGARSVVCVGVGGVGYSPLTGKGRYSDAKRQIDYGPAVAFASSRGCSVSFE